jgi:hypothetical protein
MPISRMQQPRQMYGLGSFVKKAVKKVANVAKDVVSSDIGKAALLYAGTAGLGSLGAGKGLGSLLRGSTYLPSNVMSNLGASFINFKATPFGEKIFGTAVGEDMTRTGGLLNFLKTPAGFATAAGAASLAGGMFTAKEQEEIEELRESDPEALKGYLRRYYKNLNPNADQIEVESFVRTNAAYGGRMGFADGTEEFLTMQQAAERDPAMFVDTTTSAYGDAGEGRPVPRFLQDKLQTLKEAERGISPKNRIALFKQYLDQALQTGEISEQKYREMLMPFFGKKGEEETQKIEEYNRKFRAYGGRMNYAFGNQPEQNAIQASGIGGLPLNQNPAGITELDLRDNGGFIPPVGVKEKADDIPAMLSNNEFVFTADAVRGMGEGDVNVGAQRMYDMMKKLENGGRV